MRSFLVDFGFDFLTCTVALRVGQSTRFKVNLIPGWLSMPRIYRRSRAILLIPTHKMHCRPLSRPTVSRRPVSLTSRRGKSCCSPSQNPFTSHRTEDGLLLVKRQLHHGFSLGATAFSSQ